MFDDELHPFIFAGGGSSFQVNLECTVPAVYKQFSAGSGERCGKEEWREGTRGEAVHGDKELLASACWRMVKTWLRAACHWCALIRIISAGSCVTLSKAEDCAVRDLEGQYIKYGGITAQMGSDKLNVGSDKTHVGQW